MDLYFKRAGLSCSAKLMMLIKCSSCLRRQASSVLSHWIPAKNMPEWRLCGVSTVLGRFDSARYMRQWRVSGSILLAVVASPFSPVELPAILQRLQLDARNWCYLTLTSNTPSSTWSVPRITYAVPARPSVNAGRRASASVNACFPAPGHN